MEIKWPVRKVGNPLILGKFVGVDDIEQLKASLEEAEKPVKMYSAVEEIKEFDEDNEKEESDWAARRREKKRMKFRRRPEEKIYLRKK